MTTVLVVDNYDSFVYTIVSYLRELGVTVDVVRNDEVPHDKSVYDGVLISPGPGRPAGAGESVAAIQWCAQNSIPMLGICLGHQALGEALGATVGFAPELVHGKTSLVEHDGTGIFSEVPNPVVATRYHSLVVLPETVPSTLRVTATTASEHGPIVMGLQHRELPLFGLQFHPESVMSQKGYRLLANWLRYCGAGPSILAQSNEMTPLPAH